MGSLYELDKDGNLITTKNVKHEGIYHEIDAISININNGHILSNAGFSDQIARTASRVDVYLGEAETSLASDFIAGVPSVNGPVITIADLSKFIADEIVLVTGTTENNGLYEVQGQSGFAVILRGVGSTEAKVEDFTRNDCVTVTESGTVRKVNVSVHRTSLTGTTEHGGGSSTPIVFHQLAHADDVPIVATEEFASTNARFFGELGLPDTQGWVDTELNTGTIVISADTVFGTSKDVIKYNIAASGDTTKSEIALAALDWTNILTFGASYSGVCRITEDISTQSIFSGMGFSTANDPRPSSIQSRVGIFISENGTHTTITLDGQAVVVLDGTGGNPLVLKDDYFSWEVFIDPTPDAGVNFGAANLSVNGVIVKVGGIVSSNNAVNDEVSVANSSSTGTTTFYFADFGVTIYEEVATKTLTATTMAADIAQIFIPGGARDYTVVLPDGNPRKLGNKLDIVSANIGGKVTLATQNISSPEAIFNGLRNLTFDVVSVESVCGINTVDNNNVYVGFDNSPADPDGFFGMIMTDSTTQTAPAPGVKKAISLDTVKRNVGFTHGGGLPATEMTVAKQRGEHSLLSIPQFVSGGGGAGKIELSWEKALAATPTVFVTIKGSPVSDSIASSSDGILACEIYEELEIGDIVRAMWATDSSNINITAPTSLVGDVIPSVQQYITFVGT